MSLTDLAGGGHGTAAGAPPANTDVLTGEVMPSTAVLRPTISSPTTPMTVVDVAAQCRSVEVWAERCDSIPELKDADNKLAAIGEYVKRTSTEGRAKVEAARRRLEVRIGQLLGPAQHGGDRKSDQVDREELDDGLTAKQRSEARKMADHPDVVEAVISESTDESPASRRRTMDEINRTRSKPPTEEEIKAAGRAAAIARAAKRCEKFLDGFDQVVGLTSNPFRDEILAGLTEHDRTRLLDIEKELFA